MERRANWPSKGKGPGFVYSETAQKWTLPDWTAQRGGQSGSLSGGNKPPRSGSGCGPGSMAGRDTGREKLESRIELMLLTDQTKPIDRFRTFSSLHSQPARNLNFSAFGCFLHFFPPRFPLFRHLGVSFFHSPPSTSAFLW